MKRIMMIIGMFAVTTEIMAQELAANKGKNSSTVTWKYKYCATTKNGKVVVMNEGKEMTAEATLDNGIKITPDATVINKDGSKRALTSGECVDNNGNIIRADEQNKKMKEKK